MPFLAALLGIALAATATEAVATEAPFSRLVVPAASFGCTLNDGQLVCGIVNGKKNKHVDDQGDVQMQGQVPCPQGGGAAGFAKSKKKPCQQGGSQNSDAGSQGERSCPPGYVVLAQKNKYGAYCEPKEGFPDDANKAADACTQAGLKFAGAGSCSCGVGFVNAATGLSGAHPGDKCVSAKDYNAAHAPKICCTTRFADGASGTECTTDYTPPKTEAQVRQDMKEFARINNEPSAGTICTPK